MKEEIILSIPGKAFLVGEYLALTGGAVLVTAVGPRFELHAYQTSSMQQNPFHPNSPAGKFWIQNQNILNSYHIHFIDPHSGKGGWGGSTAEFALLYVLSKMLEYGNFDLNIAEFDFHDFFCVYREYTKNNASIYQPSGADLVGQFFGGLTLFEKNTGKIESQEWPFIIEQPIGFFLVKTGQKVVTHEHLSQLKKIDTLNFEEAMSIIKKAIQERNAFCFIEGIRLYAQELKQQGFVHIGTQNKLNQIPDELVLAKKGCGALGADVMVFFFEERKRQELKYYMETLSWVISASDRDLGVGVKSEHRSCMHEQYP